MPVGRFYSIPPGGPVSVLPPTSSGVPPGFFSSKITPGVLSEIFSRISTGIQAGKLKYLRLMPSKFNQCTNVGISSNCFQGSFENPFRDSFRNFLGVSSRYLQEEFYPRFLQENFPEISLEIDSAIHPGNASEILARSLQELFLRFLQELLPGFLH